MRFGELVRLVRSCFCFVEKMNRMELIVFFFYLLQFSSTPENIRESPPTADEWWEDVGAPETIDVYHGSDDDKSDSGERVVTHISSCNQKFHNCGYETWVRARQEWKQQTVDVVPERPQLLERSQITKGLRKNMSQRTYELPRNVALPDLINMYQDIWDSSH